MNNIKVNLKKALKDTISNTLKNNKEVTQTVLDVITILPEEAKQYFKNLESLEKKTLRETNRLIKKLGDII